MQYYSNVRIMSIYLLISLLFNRIHIQFSSQFWLYPTLGQIHLLVFKDNRNWTCDLLNINLTRWPVESFEINDINNNINYSNNNNNVEFSLTDCEILSQIIGPKNTATHMFDYPWVYRA